MVRFKLVGVLGKVMARKASRSINPSTAVSLNDETDSEIVEISKSTEVWSEYELADGSVLRVKPIIIEVIKSRTQFTSDGEPLYGMKGGLVPNMRVPAKLKKKS